MLGGIKILIIGVSLLAVGCAEFKATQLGSHAQSSTVTVGRQPNVDPAFSGFNLSEDVPKGQKLYSENCAACHGSISFSQKRGAHQASIGAAISGVKIMAEQEYLKKLSSDDLKLISLALNPKSEDAFCQVAEASPGRSTMRRMTRAEYNQTVRVLLKITGSPADKLPIDVMNTSGFTKSGEASQVSPDYLSAAFEAAEVAATEWRSKNTAITCADTNKTSSTCAKQFLANFLPRAFRSPVSDAVVNRFEALRVNLTGTSSFMDGMEETLKAVLVSPEFLYSVVLEQNPLDPKAIHSLSDYEIASRLSYFLTNGPPDDTLWGLAEAGQLKDMTVLKAQVKRMLQHPSSKEFVSNFTGEWLSTDKLSDGAYDETFKTAGYANPAPLSKALRKETEMLFDYALRNGRPTEELLTADYSFLNKELADYYGVAGNFGAEHVRVRNLGAYRRGMLSHAGVMTVASRKGSTTSPVHRGSYVLGTFTCTKITLPPAVDTPPLEGGTGGPVTVRQSLEAHTRDPSCAACHRAIDPVGLAFESFDALGRIRTRYPDNTVVDPGGQLPDGEAFEDHVRLIQTLAGKSNFRACMTEKLFAYAVGRTLSLQDRCTVKSVMKTSPRGSTIEDLIMSVVTSHLFLKQQSSQASN